MSDKKAIRQSAVLAYRKNSKGLEVLLVTSLGTQRWVLPKGHLEPNLTPRESAEKEAYEEAGIRGTVSKKSIGFYEYCKSPDKDGGLRKVEVFPMEVKKIETDWPEKKQRRREWMPLKSAISAVSEKKLQKILVDFGKHQE